MKWVFSTLNHNVHHSKEHVWYLQQYVIKITHSFYFLKTMQITIVIFTLKQKKIQLIIKQLFINSAIKIKHYLTISNQWYIIKSGEYFVFVRNLFEKKNHCSLDTSLFHHKVFNFSEQGGYCFYLSSWYLTCQLNLTSIFLPIYYVHIICSIEVCIRLAVHI